MMLSVMLLSMLMILVLFDWSNNIGPIDVKMDKSVIDDKLSFKTLGLAFFSKLYWKSTAKIVSKKI